MKSLFNCICKSKDGSNRVKATRLKTFTSIEPQSLHKTGNALSNSPFKNIPNEILLQIFRYLSVRDLCNVSLVCRSFKMIADEDDLWKPKCNAFINLHSKSYKQTYMEWMQGKSIRNKKQMELDDNYNRRIPCVKCVPPSYPLRSANQSRFQRIRGFTWHRYSTQDRTIKLSIDIDKPAPDLVSLSVEEPDFEGKWRPSAVLKQMIQRYYRFMQLKASNPSNTLLIPTLDIEIARQVHLFRPEIYRNDCIRLFGHVIDHSLVTKNETEQYSKEQAFLDTCQLYEKRFGEIYCQLPLSKQESTVVSYDWYNEHGLMNNNEPISSYWHETSFNFSSDPPNGYENPFSFTEDDIFLDLKWSHSCKRLMSRATDNFMIESVRSCSLY